MDEQRELEERIARELDGVSASRAAFDSAFLGALGRAFRFLCRHWLLIANLANGAITLGAIAVPVIMWAGYGPVGTALFSAYHQLCEQRPERSYFLLGYQMAMDQRMMAIYGSSLLAGLFFLPLRSRRPKPLSWGGYFLLLLPMAVDGTTQLFGWRESNWMLRGVTGTLFGGGTVWLMYPWLERVLRR